MEQGTNAYTLVVRPYYKGKRSAFNKIRYLAIRLLKESDFFIRNPEFTEDLSLQFGNNLSANVPGAINFYLENGVCVLSIVGNKVTSPCGLNVREELTDHEYDILAENYIILFRSEFRTVSAFIGSKIIRWSATKYCCEFIGYNRTVYINRD